MSRLAEQDILLQGTSINLSFGGKRVLEDVSLTIKSGEIVTLIGPNGSGKTTLSRVLLGLQAADSGKVFKKENITIGYMPQKLLIERVLPLTVRRFLRIIPNKFSLRGKNHVEAIAEKLGISHIISHQIHDISGGEMQRVLLARALLREPDIMVLDEPVQGMDVHGQAEFYHLLETIRKEQQCSILMISHDLHMVMASTSRVICMNRHICCQGYAEEISKHPEYLALFGKKEAESIAVYTHDHDHTHNAAGHICTEHETEKEPTS